MAAASWALIPGAGEVFALGAGAAALLGLLGKKAGAAAGAKLTKNVDADVVRDEQSAADAEVFLGILKTDRSLIVVRTESHETAKTACVIFDRMGIAGTATPPILTPPVGKNAGGDQAGWKRHHGIGNTRKNYSGRGQCGTS